MKKILFIGPFPPPLHGESLAMDNLYKSSILQESFILNKINTNRENVTKAGAFSIIKIFKDIIIILNILLKRSDVFYLSLSQTKLGLFRDLLIINLCSFKGEVVVHLHGNRLGSTIDDLSPRRKRIINKTFAKIKVAIVLGENLKHNFKGMVSNIKVVDNGIDKNTIELPIIKSANIEPIRLLYLSNLIETKGFLDLAIVCSKIIRDGRFEIELNLAGAVHDEEAFIELKKIINNTSIKSINYIGVVTGEDKKNLLLKSDLMILPTRYPTEGQPLSIIEGMSAGLPIISTKQGCIPNMIENNGIILNDLSHDTLKKAIEYYLQNHEAREIDSEKSRELFDERFTLEVHANKMKIIFQEVCSS